MDDIAQRFAEAFNAKDADALGSFFTQDAEFVSIFGGRLRGRDAIAAGHAAVFSNVLSGNRLVVGPADVKLLADDVLLAHVPWTRDRLADAAEVSLPPGTGLFTMVVTQEQGTWALAAATNVQDAVPPGR